jgi:hypothetical protein
MHGFGNKWLEALLSVAALFISSSKFECNKIRLQQDQNAAREY